jgi:excisionase family DNA binding protein
MTTALLKVPTADTAEQAEEALRKLARVARKDARSVQVRATAGGAGEAVTVPRDAFELFLEILGQMANGNAVTIVPVHAELTTQEAADMLNVSRPHLVELLESGKLPFRRVGTHRRVRVGDLVTYQEEDDARRKAVLDELTEEAQKHGLGY